MFKIMLGIVLGFCVGTCTGISATKFRAIAKVHKDLADRFKESEDSGKDEAHDKQRKIT